MEHRIVTDDVQGKKDTIEEAIDYEAVKKIINEKVEKSKNYIDMILEKRVRDESRKKLINNFIVFLTGSFGSKLLQFLLIPLYTSILSPQEYGTVDVLQTVSMLLIPIFSLTIAESVFRYGMEDAFDKKEVFSIGLSITGIGSALLIAVGVILNFFLENSDMIFLMILLSIFNMLRTVTSQFLRATGKVKLFTIDNVLQTCGILGLNLVFLLVFRWGSRGYLLGYVGGNCISFLFGIVACGLWKYVSFSAMKKSTYRVMLKFSVPLIPNTICWWISSSTDRLMLTAMVGAAANGLYSVAHKIPSIISIIVNVFIQAWQISANEEFEEKIPGNFMEKFLAHYLFLVL